MGIGVYRELNSFGLILSFLGQGEFRCVTRKQGEANRKSIVYMVRIHDAEANVGRYEKLLDSIQ